jgi:hypothetical protein
MPGTELTEPEADRLPILALEGDPTPQTVGELRAAPAT